MAGLVAEGEEVIEEGEEKEDTTADLALIGAAQRVEHYEISAYTTARNLAQQLRRDDVRPVGHRLGRIVVGLQEHALAAHRQGGAHQPPAAKLLQRT